MNIIAVKGSPRRNGDSNKLINEVLRGARDAGHHVTEYFVQGMNLKGCQACYVCKQPGKAGRCVLRDDLQLYWEQLAQADALVLGAPIYAGSLCGPMISYMNRHYCLLDKDWNVHLKPGIKVIGIFTQGAGDPKLYEDRMDWFLSDFERRNMVVVDKMVRTGAMSEEENDAMLHRAYEDGLYLAEK